MKKLIVICSITLLVYSCSNGETSENKNANDTQNEAAPAEVPKDPEVARGLKLVANSDCFTCHKVVEASQGPAYEKVAARYPNNEAVMDSISKKIITGGSGNWGTIPMTPHPDLSEADAKTMIKYIMSLKK